MNLSINLTVGLVNGVGLKIEQNIFKCALKQENQSLCTYSFSKMLCIFFFQFFFKEMGGGAKNKQKR